MSRVESVSATLSKKPSTLFFAAMIPLPSPLITGTRPCGGGQEAAYAQRGNGSGLAPGKVAVSCYSSNSMVSLRSFLAFTSMPFTTRGA